jgi:hypothetical protein
MAETIGTLGYRLNGYFLRNGVTKSPAKSINGLIRLTERVTGKVCGADKAIYLREFAESVGIDPFPMRVRVKGKKRRIQDDAFYLSREWLALRYRVLRESDGKCQCCGATAQTSGRPLHIDHIIPRSINPSLALEYTNLQVLCADCNLGKSNSDSINWKAKNVQSA